MFTLIYLKFVFLHIYSETGYCESKLFLGLKDFWKISRSLKYNIIKTLDMLGGGGTGFFFLTFIEKQ